MKKNDKSNNKNYIEKSNRDEKFKYHIQRIGAYENYDDDIEAKDGDFVLGIRPEFVDFDVDGYIDGEIYGAMPSGMESTMKIKIKDYLLTTVIFGGITYPIGTKGGVSFKGNTITLYDRVSGKLISTGKLVFDKIGEEGFIFLPYIKGVRMGKRRYDLGFTVAADRASAELAAVLGFGGLFCDCPFSKTVGGSAILLSASAFFPMRISVILPFTKRMVMGSICLLAQIHQHIRTKMTKLCRNHLLSGIYSRLLQFLIPTFGYIVEDEIVALAVRARKLNLHRAVRLNCSIILRCGNLKHGKLNGLFLNRILCTFINRSCGQDLGGYLSAFLKCRISSFFCTFNSSFRPL